MNSSRSEEHTTYSEKQLAYTSVSSRNVVISGVGLIGGSIGMALRSQAKPPKVIGVGRNKDRLQKAVDLGAIDSFSTEWSEVINDDSLVVLCGPVSTIADQALAAWSNRACHSLIFTDAGSTKQAIMNRVTEANGLPEFFVGAHPIAGSERSGVDAARGDLFLNRSCVITPTGKNPEPILAEVRAFWQSLGCQLVEMSPSEHDQALAMTSHVPHVLSAILARYVPQELHQVSAGAFRDMTRIAGADATLWSDIFISNSECIEKSLELIAREMLNFREILSQKSSTELIQWWNEARNLRNALESSVYNSGNGTSGSRPV